MDSKFFAATAGEEILKVYFWKSLLCVSVCIDTECMQGGKLMLATYLPEKY